MIALNSRVTGAHRAAGAREHGISHGVIGRLRVLNRIGFVAEDVLKSDHRARLSLTLCARPHRERQQQSDVFGLNDHKH